ncbi:unnamed protein product, partial [Prorocentrum cordatum]
GIFFGVAEERPPLQDGAAQPPAGDFATGHVSCFDDYPICLHACFCACCRAGDTYQAAGIEPYWTVIGIFIILDLDLIPSLIVGAVFQHYRRKLRVVLGGSEEGAPSVVVDCLMYAICTQRVVAQEARELDAATSVEVECCCKLTAAAGAPLDGRPFVGQPQPLIGQ